jgi:Na+/proline symporter
VCLPAVAIATFLTDIQTLMKYFSSIFGFMLMFVIPCSLIYAYRSKFSTSHIDDGKLNKAILRNGLGLLVFAFIGIVTLGLIVYGFLMNKKSDYHCVENYLNN